MLLEVLLRLNPQLVVDPSLARELGWRARHVTGATAEAAVTAGIDRPTSFAGG